jgi:hypothetical protein
VVPPDRVNRVDWADSLVYVDLTRRQIRESPEFHAKA